MMLAIYGIICLLLGVAVGYFVGERRERRIDKAPVPFDFGFDPNNPINRKAFEKDDYGLEDVRQWQIF